MQNCSKNIGIAVQNIREIKKKLNFMNKDLFFQLSQGTKFSSKNHDKEMKLFTNGELSASSAVFSKEEVRFLPVQNLDFFGDLFTKVKEEQLSDSDDNQEIAEEEQDDADDNEADVNEQIDENEDEQEEDDSNNAEEEDDDTTQQINLDNLSKLSKSQVQQIHTQRKIYVKGDEIPSPFTHFEHLPLKNYIKQNIKQKLKFETPTTVQMQAIPILMKKRETLILAPTGSGKTISYILPILYGLKQPEKLGIRALVIAPTRVLVEQIYREFCILCKNVKWRIKCNTESRNLDKMREQFQSKRQDIFITTPKFLNTLLHEQILHLDQVQYLVLDEADRLMEMGFLEQMDEIIAACTNPHVVRCLLSATVPIEVEHLSTTFLRNPIRVIIGNRNATAETIEQKLEFVGSEGGKLLAIKTLLKTTGVEPPVLVFVNSAEKAKQLYQELLLEDCNVEYIHAKRSDAQNREIVNQFRLGKIWILICTDVMGRGLDFKGVKLVINYDFPHTATGYIHRIGRTGRSGRLGKAVTYFTHEDLPDLKSISSVMKKSGCDVPDWMLQITASSSSKSTPSLKRKKSVKEEGTEEMVPNKSQSHKRRKK